MPTSFWILPAHRTFPGFAACEKGSHSQILPSQPRAFPGLRKPSFPSALLQRCQLRGFTDIHNVWAVTMQPRKRDVSSLVTNAPLSGIFGVDLGQFKRLFLFPSPVGGVKAFVFLLFSISLVLGSGGECGVPCLLTIPTRKQSVSFPSSALRAGPAPIPYGRGLPRGILEALGPII